MASWNAALSQNGVNITFDQMAPPPEGDPSYTFLYFQSGTLYNPDGTVATNYAASYHTESTYPDGTVQSATITFNTNGALANPGDPSLGIPPGTDPFYDPTKSGYDTIFEKESEHEMGHPLGLTDMNGSAGASVMNNDTFNCPNDNCGRKPVGVTPCDRDASGQFYSRGSPTPTPPPTPEECEICNDPWAFQVDGNCSCPPAYDEVDGCCYDSFGGGGGGSDCGDGCDYWNPCWCGTCDSWGWGGFGMCSWIEPILIDLNGDGFDLTNDAHGVTFDFFSHGNPLRISWTASASDDAWLVLDRDGNGKIDNGKELFSNVTPQSRPHTGSPRLGFLALGMYDRAAHGGNDDGVIDNNDRIFNELSLWQDVNHNGISEPSELHSLSELGVESISLNYKESQRRDRFGNVFKYRAKVYGPNHTDLGRWAYDVYLLPGAPRR